MRTAGFTDQTGETARIVTYRQYAYDFQRYVRTQSLYTGRTARSHGRWRHSPDQSSGHTQYSRDTPVNRAPNRRRRPTEGSECRLGPSHLPCRREVTDSLSLT